ncbi:MAG: hypothetical protein A2Y70_08700 [Candidatus Aminicenantes bacterium RBG_13_64_14]|nr:MAG: hypothetical protein A2Y70_08700 [Candidatus Aminicenantes bacterium RBG_13_64_14]
MTPFTEKAKALIKRIPRGRVATYGQIAFLAGFDGGARQVAWLLHSSSAKDRLPWHRVIGGRGRISLPRGCGFETQLRRLRAEGVNVPPSGRIDLGRYLWEPRFSTASNP